MFKRKLALEELEDRVLLSAYVFSKIADTAAGYTGLGMPSINNPGQVAFVAGLASGESGVFRGDGQAVVTIADTTNPNIAGFGNISPSTGTRPTINDSGVVAFWAELSEDAVWDEAIWAGDENNLFWPWEDRDGALSTNPSINNEGLITFWNFSISNGNLICWRHAIDIGRTCLGAPATISGFTHPAIDDNEVWTLVFEGSSAAGGNAIVTRRMDTIPFAFVVDTSGEFSDFGAGPLAGVARPAINNNGAVAFQASLDVGGEGIFIADEGDITRLADTTGQFASFGNPSLNDHGTAAFIAGFDGGGIGIYTARVLNGDVVVEEVLRSGDELFDQVVTGLGFSRDGLNNSGQLAFWASLADGTTGIYRADVVAPLTVITHGLRVSFPPWVLEMARAVNGRLPLAAQCSEEAIGNSIVVRPGDRSSCEHLVLFDWALNSVLPGSADSDGVAGVLALAVANVLAVEQEPVDIHFIGHSRGTYVNAEVIRRLAKGGVEPHIGFLQMTTLDAQSFWTNPLDTDGTLEANPGGIVDWADNYYQFDEGSEGFRLDGAFNLNLTTIVANWESGNSGHSEVHDWYHWTIDTSNPDPNPYDDVPDINQTLRETILYVPQEWENGNKIGYYYSLVGGGARTVDTAGLFDPAVGMFRLRNSNTPGAADAKFRFGPRESGWLPVTGDWDGDGVDTAGLFDPAAGIFRLRNSNTPGVADILFRFGPMGSGRTPLVGDWDGDGTDTVGLFSPVTSTFYLKNSNAPGVSDVVFRFGPMGSGRTPLVGDWDGDGTDTVGLYDPVASEFYLKNSHTPGNADQRFLFGPPDAGRESLAGDWNSDGLDTVGLYRPSAGIFYLRDAHAGGNADVIFRYGPGDLGWLPIMGDWNGPEAAISGTSSFAAALPARIETELLASISLSPSWPAITTFVSPSHRDSVCHSELDQGDSASVGSVVTEALCEAALAANSFFERGQEELTALDVALLELLEERLLNNVL